MVGGEFGGIGELRRGAKKGVCGCVLCLDPHHIPPRTPLPPRTSLEHTILKISSQKESHVSGRKSGVLPSPSAVTSLSAAVLQHLPVSGAPAEAHMHALHESSCW